MNQNLYSNGAVPQSNPSYPMAGLQGSTYAPPLNYNKPTEVVGGYDANINPMTGQEIPEVNFAKGGNVNSETGLASLLASRGRNGDSMLVHMAPNEVKGLQSLALAHGGSLTINPDTGLVEANFLKSLLPTIIGAVLTPLTGGLINPLTAGLIVGGVEGVRTGDLGKGLMAGLGAYGGAGLSAALAGAGAAGAAGATAAGAAAPAATTAAGAAVPAATTAVGTEAAKTAAEQALAQQAARQAGTKSIQQAVAGAGKGMFTPLKDVTFSNIGSGLGQVFGTSGGTGALAGLSGTDVARSALGSTNIAQKAGLASAGLSALQPEMKTPKNPSIDTSYYESYGYSPEEGRFLGGEWKKDYPGLEGYAEGGDVETSNRGYTEMPLDSNLAQPNSAKAGWMEYMQKNPDAQKVYLDNGYPASFFQQDPQKFTGARPFIPGKDAPQAPAGIATNLDDYMSQLNKYVASPIAAPPRKTPPPATTPPTIPGRPNRDDFDGVDFSGIDFGNFMGGGMNGLAAMIGNNYRGNDSRMQWDPDTGSFTQPSMNRPQQPAPAATPPAYNPFNYSGRPIRGYDSDMGDMGDYMGSRGVPPTTPMGDGMYGPTTGNQQIEMGDMSEPRELAPVSTPYSPRIIEEEPALPAPTTPKVPAPAVTPFSEPEREYIQPIMTPFSEPERDYMPAPYMPTYEYKPSADRNFMIDSDNASFYAGGGSVQYAAAGRLLRGPGDGMSDDIKANISGKQEARLADGEFVIPADVVSHLGNGSSEAGSRKLYKMMANIRKARTGRSKQAPAVKPDKYLPA